MPPSASAVCRTLARALPPSAGAVRYEVERARERALTWLAWAVPRPLAYWCAVRVVTAATVGRYSDTEVGRLLAVDALDAWDGR